MPKFYNVGQTQALQSLVWPDLFPTLTAGIPKPVGDGDVIRFLISIEFGYVTGKYMRL